MSDIDEKILERGSIKFEFIRKGGRHPNKNYSKPDEVGSYLFWVLDENNEKIDCILPAQYFSHLIPAYSIIKIFE